MTEQMIKQIKESLQRSKMFIALGAFESLVIENEQLKQKLVGKENEFKYFSNSYKMKIKQLKAQIEKMKCCGNCKHCDSDNPCRFHQENRQCDNYGFCELAE